MTQQSDSSSEQSQTGTTPKANSTIKTKVTNIIILVFSILLAIFLYQGFGTGSLQASLSQTFSRVGSQLGLQPRQ